MKPVAIFRHARTEEAGYLGTFLDEHSIPWHVIKVDENEPVPEDPAVFSGLAFMGGPMSVNDDLAWITRELALIRSAVDRDVPVLGHCLGGQLMSKALGGVVSQNRVKEIGWGAVQIGNHPHASAWFGDLREFSSFHWHGETFSIPPGGTRIAANLHCDNQAFAMGRHLAMQFHIEMTETLVKTWCESGAAEIAASNSPAVQSVTTIQQGLGAKVRTLNLIAARVYTRWISGLAIG